jgi:tight adherence protein B
MAFIEAVGLTIRRLRTNRGRINRRLNLYADASTPEETLQQLRRDRRLSETGSLSNLLRLLNQLILQSGIRTRGLAMAGILVIGGLLGLFAAAVSISVFRIWLLALPFGLICGVSLPLLLLRIMRNRRRAKFATQLPEALDIMVRSLRAGHPVPIALSLVARELPHPSGTEFGITADEMTFGLDLEAALQNMSLRVGQQDLPFLVVAVSIQSKTGGNLAELLANLSRVIRDRFKLRRRVTAMSAEGRWSASALSLIPLIVFGMINLVAPNFCGDVKNDPLIAPIATLTFLLWTTGVYSIYRLVNFKY